MALRGAWQLQKLVLSFSDLGGSSRGIRAFMESHLPAFGEKNPQLDFVTQLIRGQHPHLKGLYRNKNERVICVKNMDPEDRSGYMDNRLEILSVLLNWSLFKLILHKGFRKPKNMFLTFTTAD
nr:54s ribosomal protein l51, mitochondrial [Quercus suber]